MDYFWHNWWQIPPHIAHCHFRFSMSNLESVASSVHWFSQLSQCLRIIFCTFPNESCIIHQKKIILLILDSVISALHCRLPAHIHMLFINVPMQKNWTHAADEIVLVIEPMYVCARIYTYICPTFHNNSIKLNDVIRKARLQVFFLLSILSHCVDTVARHRIHSFIFHSHTWHDFLFPHNIINSLLECILILLHITLQFSIINIPIRGYSQLVFAKYRYRYEKHWMMMELFNYNYRGNWQFSHNIQ